MKCDNMTTAVAQVLKGTDRIISDGFYRFMLHHSLLKTFRRSYGKSSEDVDWKDYIPSLVKKPGATSTNLRLVPHTSFLQSNAEVMAGVSEKCSRKRKKIRAYVTFRDYHRRK
ncbi:MAG: hypothetical protein LBC86_06255 [Oscillospiraceae bacterium]|nr:hypothetical protein [Oscillospiraceae bacterium]